MWHFRKENVFVHVLYLTVTFDDNFFDIYAVDNQVDDLSSRKADAEEHSADALACTITRVVFVLRFQQREESQLEAVTNLLTEMFEVVGSQTLNICIVNTERGYRKESFMNVTVSFVLSSIFFMPDHGLRLHTFVEAPYLHPHQNGEDLLGSKSRGAIDVVASNDDAKQSIGDMEIASLGKFSRFEDRLRAIIINDDPMLGPAVFSATKALRSQGLG